MERSPESDDPRSSRASTDENAVHELRQALDKLLETLLANKAVLRAENAQYALPRGVSFASAEFDARSEIAEADPGPVTSLLIGIFVTICTLVLEYWMFPVPGDLRAQQILGACSAGLGIVAWVSWDAATKPDDVTATRKGEYASLLLEEVRSIAREEAELAVVHDQASGTSIEARSQPQK